MANTYTQLYIHVVFATKRRGEIDIPEEHREEVEKYLCGIAKNLKCHPIAIYCNPDHLHFLYSQPPSASVSDVVRDLKTFSSRFINEKNLTKGHFEWQSWYGAFSYSRSQLDSVSSYIFNQPKHHKKQNFRDEYLALLQAFDISYDEQYLFSF